MAQAHAHEASKYYIPHGSPWPIYAAVTLFTVMLGAVSTLNEWLPAYSLIPGFVMLVFLFIFWFRTVIGESQAGIYNAGVDRSFRLGMMWFIFSEVMFFAAFFGALFYISNMSVPWLGDMENKLLWPNYTSMWPTNGPYIADAFTPMGAIGIPLLNTILLV